MTDCEILELAPQATAVVRGNVPMAELPAFFSRAFHSVFTLLEQQGVTPAGEPFGLYAGLPTDTVTVEAGVAVSREIAASGDVVPSQLPGGRVATAVHVGPYDTLERTYAELQQWVTEQGITPAPGPMWETYLTDPQAEPDPARWETRVFQPVL